MSFDRPAFAAGVRAAMPVLIGVVPFGVITGVAMVASGIPPVLAMAISVFVFAGASMVAAAQLLASGTPALMIVLTTAFINLRFLMYGASLRPHFLHLSLPWRLLLGYLNADTVYALCSARFAEQPGAAGKLEYFLGSGSAIWLVWQAAVLGGIVIGSGVPASWRLEFAAPLAFIAMTIPHLRDRAMAAAALAAGVTVVAAHELPLRLAVIAAALAGMAVGLAVETRTGRRA